MSVEITAPIQLVHYFGESSSVSIAELPNINNVKQIYTLVDGNYRAWNRTGGKAFDTIDYGSGYLIVSEDNAPASYTLISGNETLPETINITSTLNIVRYVGSTVDLTVPENITNFKQIYKLVDGNYRAWNKDGGKAFTTIDDGETYLISSEENAPFPYLFASIIPPDNAYVVSSTNLHKIETRGNTIVDSLSIGATITSFLIYPERGKIYLGRSGYIYVVDINTFSVVCSIMTNSTSTNLYRKDNLLYSVNATNQIRIIDLDTNRLIDISEGVSTLDGINSFIHTDDLLYVTDNVSNEVHIFEQQEIVAEPPPPEPPPPTTTLAPGVYCVDIDAVDFPYPCLKKKFRKGCVESTPKSPSYEIYKFDREEQRLVLNFDPYQYGESLKIESISDAGVITEILDTGEFIGSDDSSFDDCSQAFGNKVRTYEFYKPENIRYLRITLQSNDPKNLTGYITGLAYELCYPCYGTTCPVGYSISQISCECVINNWSGPDPTPPPDPPKVNCDLPFSVQGYAFYKREGSEEEPATATIPGVGTVKITRGGGHCCNRTIFTPKLYFSDGTCLYADKTINLNNGSGGDEACGEREDTFKFNLPDGKKIDGDTQMMLECLNAYALAPELEDGTYIPSEFCELNPSNVGCHDDVTWIVLTAQDQTSGATKLLFSNYVVPSTLEGVGIICNDSGGCGATWCEPISNTEYTIPNLFTVTADVASGENPGPSLAVGCDSAALDCPDLNLQNDNNYIQFPAGTSDTYYYFSEPQKDLLLFIGSLGDNAQQASITFDVPFEIVCSSTNDTLCNSEAPTSITKNGNTIYGNQGFGVIKFNGIHKRIRVQSSNHPDITLFRWGRCVNCNIYQLEPYFSNQRAYWPRSSNPRTEEHDVPTSEINYDVVFDTYGHGDSLQIFAIDTSGSNGTVSLLSTGNVSGTSPNGGEIETGCNSNLEYCFGPGPLAYRTTITKPVGYDKIRTVVTNSSNSATNVSGYTLSLTCNTSSNPLP